MQGQTCMLTCKVVSCCKLPCCALTPPLPVSVQDRNCRFVRGFPTALRRCMIVLLGTKSDPQWTLTLPQMGIDYPNVGWRHWLSKTEVVSERESFKDPIDKEPSRLGYLAENSWTFPVSLHSAHNERLNKWWFVSYTKTITVILTIVY